MLQKQYKTRKRTITERIVVYQKRICDVCGCDINDSYWTIITGNNDISDPYIEEDDKCEYYDVCSKYCLNEIINEYYNRSECYNIGKNTEFIGIKRKKYKKNKEDEING